ncbi:hypothetical protein D5I55_04480 [Chakrabartia godavariana]|nr:hypothetical protein D5I55_04480 [Chakrabartia godavariana]
MTVLLVKLGGSLLAILGLAWLAKLLNLGGDLRIRDAAHAREIANEAVYGFDATDIVIDRAGMGALLKDVQGRQMLIRRHGAGFVGRLLDQNIEARLDQNFLTIGTGERTFGTITLNLGDAAQYWAAGLRHLPA